jgi:hypothetical protein
MKCKYTIYKEKCTYLLYIVWKYIIYLYDLYKQVEKQAFGDLF